MSADNLLKPAYCPSCGAQASGAQPGQMHTCPNCSQTARMAADPPAPKSALNITANVVSIGGKVVLGDDHTTINNFGPGATPPAPVEASVAPAPSGFVCPTCKNAVVVKPGKVRPGKKIMCPTCSLFSQISADGTRLVPVDMPEDIIGGAGAKSIRTLQVNGHNIRFEDNVWTLDDKVVPADDPLLVELLAKADRAAAKLKGLGLG